MLQAMGRMDYYKFRLPYWDWRHEIQTSYGFPSEDLFSFNRFGETRNISNRPVVFGDLVSGWNAICHDTVEICDPNNSSGPIQRCPFVDNPALCESSNTDWPSIEETNLLFDLPSYSLEPFQGYTPGALRDEIDFPLVATDEECRQDNYCQCVPGGPMCPEVPANVSVLRIRRGVHARVRN